MLSHVVPAGRKGVDDPDRTAVSDHEHGLVGVSVQDLLEEAANALPEGVEGLGIVRAEALAGLPATVRLGEAALDLDSGETFPRTEAALTQPRVEPNLDAQTLGDDLRRLPGAGEVARIHDVDTVELLGELTSLPSAELVQRRVGLALPASVSVPVGFAVPDEEQSGHRG